MSMLMNRSLPAALLLTISLSAASAQDYSAEPIEGAPDTDRISAELKAQLAGQGIKVKRGSRTACEIWLCKEWSVDAGFEATDERLYPFTPGQLIGVLHFGRRGSDFRDQTVGRGWYTLRFALQPVDGNHEGTSPTRDFLVLVDAEQDASNKEWSTEDLMMASAEVAGSSHPAMMCLQRTGDGDDLSVRHNESSDWWILRATGRGVDGDQAQDVPIDLIVGGHATE